MSLLWVIERNHVPTRKEFPDSPAGRKQAIRYLNTLEQSDTVYHDAVLRIVCPNCHQLIPRELHTRARQSEIGSRPRPGSKGKPSRNPAGRPKRASPSAVAKQHESAASKTPSIRAK